jgi:hypothetical protein
MNKMGGIGGFFLCDIMAGWFPCAMQQRCRCQHQYHRIICITSAKKKIMILDCSNILEGGASWISCVM